MCLRGLRSHLVCLHSRSTLQLQAAASRGLPLAHTCFQQRAAPLHIHAASSREAEAGRIILSRSSAGLTHITLLFPHWGAAVDTPQRKVEQALQASPSLPCPPLGTGHSLLQAKRICRTAPASSSSSHSPRKGLIAPMARAFAGRMSSYDFSKPTHEVYRCFSTSPEDFHGQFREVRMSMDYSWHTNFSRERQLFQDSIVRELLSSSAEGGFVNPWVVYTAGPMGTGKSFTLRHLSQAGLFPLRHFVFIDPDKIKDKLPEMPGYIARNKEQAGSLTHRESVFIAELAEREAMQQRRNILVDSSLRDSAWFQKVFSRVRSDYPCYRIGIIYVTASREKVYERACRRASTTGRVVPLSVLDAALEQVPKSFEVLKPLADYTVTVDNNDDKVLPRIVEPDTAASFQAAWQGLLWKDPQSGAVLSLDVLEQEEREVGAAVLLTQLQGKERQRQRDKEEAVVQSIAKDGESLALAAGRHTSVAAAAAGAGAAEALAGAAAAAAAAAAASGAGGVVEGEAASRSPRFSFPSNSSDDTFALSPLPEDIREESSAAGAAQAARERAQLAVTAAAMGGAGAGAAAEVLQREQQESSCNGTHAVCARAREYAEKAQQEEQKEQGKEGQQQQQQQEGAVSDHSNSSSSSSSSSAGEAREAGASAAFVSSVAAGGT